MGLQLQSAINTAISVLNDTGGVTYLPEDLLQYANDALKTIVPMRPELFETRGEVVCVAGAVVQEVTFDGAIMLVSVDRIKEGDVVTLADQHTLDRWNPSWRTATPAAAKHWMPHANNPLRFLHYPPAPANQILEVTYVAPPADAYAADEDTGLPVTLAPAIADYIIGMAMSRDDEHINANRAQAFMGSFAARVKGA